MGTEIKGLRNTILPTRQDTSKAINGDTQVHKPSSTNISLLEAATKTDKKQTNKNSNNGAQKTLAEKIESGIKHGIEYLKGVRDQARTDRQEGVKPLAGANKLWESLVSKAEEIGQKAQDSVLDDFAEKASKVVSEQIKGTQIGTLLEDFIGSSSSAATNATGKTSTGSTTATSSSNAATGTIGKVVGGIGAAYSLYSLFNDFGKSSPMVSGMHGATLGAYVGSVVPGVGTVLGGVVGFAAGAVMGLFNSGKHPERIARDNLRSSLRDYGFLDQNNNISLADGSKYSFATENKNKLQNLDGTERNGYQIDFGNTLTHQAIGWMQPLAEVMTSGNQKLKTDLLGYMVNAVTSNATTEEEVRANVVSIYEQSKLDLEMVLSGLTDLVESGQIKEGDIPAYVNGLETLVTLPEENSTLSEEAIAA